MTPRMAREVANRLIQWSDTIESKEAVNE